MHMFDEVKEIAAGYKASAEFVNGTTPAPTGLAIHFSHSANITLKEQPQASGFDYLGQFLERIYKPMIGAQYRPDVIDPSVDLSSYRLVVSPFLPSLDESGLRDRHEELDRGWWHLGGRADDG